MNPKTLLKIATVILFCALANNCSSDLDFDQINDFSAEPEIAANLAYFELLSNTAAPADSVGTAVKFDLLNESFLRDNLNKVTLQFELESKEVKQYKVKITFKDDADQILERITIDRNDNFDGVNELSKEVTYLKSDLDFLKFAKVIEFKVTKIGVTRPIVISDDTLKFRSSAIVNLLVQ